MNLAEAQHAITEFFARPQKWTELARRIHATPELKFEEEHAARWLTEALAEEGFEITRGLTAGLPTSFQATWGSGSPHIVFMAEYDALPGIGHACGHNLIAGSGASAGAALKQALEATGTEAKVSVVGTPAEEGGGGKVFLADAGIFDDADAALMVHPADTSMSYRGNRACVELSATFHGKAAHAASRPHMGINALDATINSFMTIRQLMPSLHSSANVHGIITKGGEAFNIIPDHCEAEFLLRADTVETLEDVRRRVTTAIEHSAESIGASTTIEYGVPYAEIRPIYTMCDRFGEHLQRLGEDVKSGDGSLGGSSDVGNVGRIIPTIHPFLRIGDAVPHTEEFAEAAASDYGMEQMVKAATALAMTGIDLIADPGMLQEARDEHAQRYPAGPPALIDQAHTTG